MKNLKKKQKCQLILAVIVVFAALSIFLGIHKYLEMRAETIGGKNYFTKRYVYFSLDNTLTANSNAEKTRLLGVMNTAAGLGYNGIVLHGGDLFNYAQDQANKDAFLDVTNTANTLGLAIVPEHFDQYDATYEHKNIEEALPVKDTTFLAQSGTATAQTNTAVTVPNGNFESWRVSPDLNTPTDGWVDDQGVTVKRDSTVNHTSGGSSSVLVTSPQKNANHWGRIFLYEPKYVDTYRAYQFSLWIKTENFKQPEKIGIYIEGKDASGATRSLLETENFAAMTGSSGVLATQGWTQYKVVFNSLDSVSATLAFGAWGTDSTDTTTWKAWFDDAQVQEVGLYNAVRRTSCPVTVKSADGATTYTEGTDYVVGNQVLTIPAGSRITNGSKPKVSYCMQAIVANYAMVPSNACHQEYWDTMSAGATRVNQLLSTPHSYLIAYDEWRIANWDSACRATNKQVNGVDADMTGGEYMAYAEKQTETIVKQANPSAELLVWGDMFDPYQNAVSKYYVVNGPINNVIQGGTEIHKGSWTGVSPSTTILNWNDQNKADSLKFFAGRGNHQIIAGYYNSLSNVTGWLDMLDSLESSPGGIAGIDGFMYTTWTGDYSGLASVANLIKSRGRWGVPATPTPTSTITSTPTQTPTSTPTSTPTPQDLTPPIVSITDPVNGSTVRRGNLILRASAIDDKSGVKKIEFYIGTSLVCTDTSSPYACTWKAGRGTYSLKAKAYDNAGNVGTSATIQFLAK